MHDPLLEHVIALAEEETPIEAEITLMVGGMLITGHVVSYETYMGHHALTRGYFELDLEEGIDGAEAGDAEEADEEEDEVEDEDGIDDEAAFVHLRDARVHAPGQAPAGNAGFYRIALGDVAGFSLVR